MHLFRDDWQITQLVIFKSLIYIIIKIHLKVFFMEEKNAWYFDLHAETFNNKNKNTVYAIWYRFPGVFEKKSAGKRDVDIVFSRWYSIKRTCFTIKHNAARCHVCALYIKVRRIRFNKLHVHCMCLSTSNLYKHNNNKTIDGC